MRRDPSRTTVLRKRFISEIARRFRLVQKELLRFVGAEDGFALSPVDRSFIANDFRYDTSPQRLLAFQEWFKELVDREVFSTVGEVDPARPWLAEYVESAYRKGVVRSYSDADVLKEGRVYVPPGILSPENFLASSFALPVSTTQVKLLYLRTLSDLKGVTADMETQLVRILARAFVDGTGPMQVAREMSEEVRELTRSRAFTIARTEIIRAHAEGQLDALAKMGIEQVTVFAEWSTAGDEQVCPKCQKKEGSIYTVAEARGLIPLHPNCRCCFLPYFPTKVKA